MTELPADLVAWLDSAAHDLDTGANVHALLPTLADAGLFKIGVPAPLGGTGGDATDAVAAIAAVSDRSLAAGFVFWGHRTFIEYLLQSPNTALRDRLLPDLLTGRRAGATGLSNAMKFLSGIEGLQIKASQAGDNLRIDGKLPWITNLHVDGFDAAAAVQGAGDAPAFIASLSSDDAGLTRSPDLDLMAMRGTSTAAITIDNVTIDASRIIHPNAGEWLPKVRPAFLGMQCAMSIGVARRALAETNALLGTGRGVLATPLDELVDDLAEAEAELLKGLRDNRFETGAEALFSLRIRLADIAAAAVQLELSASGGRAYLSVPGKGIQRRLREVAFIPLVTPSLVQLKTALVSQSQRATIKEPA